MSDAKALALAFNYCIKARDLAGLTALMSGDHVFIDTENNEVRGKQACAAAWESFFEAFPDYRNVFENIRESGDMARIAGHSECSDARLRGPALWSVKTRYGVVAEWRVYKDTPDNRTALGLT